MSEITFNEYANKVPGGIRTNISPSCKQIAVIPCVTVESTASIKGLADCFVHVTKNNTTYYIDDKHRMMITWAGPVEVDNYNYATNPLGLRSQICYDYANNRAIYFNKIGQYKFIALTSTPAGS